MVGAGRDAESIGVSAVAVGENPIEFEIVIRMLPWAVIVRHFRAIQYPARTDVLRRSENGPPIAKHAAFDLDEVLGQRLDELQVDGVHVRIPLAVRVRREVKRHTVEGDGEICSVVEIEAAKKILVGLAAAGVLSDDDTGNRLQDFSRPKNRPVLDFSCSHRSLRGGFGNSDEAILASLDGYGG